MFKKKKQILKTMINFIKKTVNQHANVNIKAINDYIKKYIFK